MAGTRYFNREAVKTFMPMLEKAGFQSAEVSKIWFDFKRLGFFPTEADEDRVHRAVVFL